MDLRRIAVATAAALWMTGVVSIATTGCSAEADSQANDESEDAYRNRGDGGRGSLQLHVTVDWEGRDLTEANIRAMETFRTRFPDVKLVHFLNAAYYTKPGAVTKDVTAKIARPLRTGDERGLHIHGWERLMEASGVTFRATPTFWGGANQLSNDCNFDCGHEVPISAYETGELRKVIKFSVDTLDKNGFGRAKSFRAGGWVATPTVREAIAAEGFRSDNSAVPATFLQSEIGTLPLHRWVADLWAGTTSTTQPYKITTPAGTIAEVADNGALSDYMTAKEMQDVYEANKRTYLANPSKNVVISIGFHQETAARFLPILTQALDGIFAAAKLDGVPIVSVTSETLATPVLGK
ncbi:MAG: hypothetical protein JWM74_6277 [Myxococcaceae bacterium]|nr:hypothetical protein [Myxococcaceae bacterium]